MYKIGLIIGRFQPFHNGHLYLLKEALKYADNIIIGIGSVNIRDESNPFSQNQIEKMLQSVLENENWTDRVIQIFGIPDFHDDMKWRQYILQHSERFDVVMGHNDWVARIFKKVQIPVIEIPFYKRELYEGIKIRKRMNDKIHWQDRVPTYIASYLERSIT